MHLPPDPDIFSRFEPGDVAQPVWFIEVEDQRGFHETAGRLADLDCPPGRDERTIADDGRISDSRGQKGVEAAAFDAHQVHAGIVDQGRFVDR